MKKSRKLACHVVNSNISNIAIDSLPTLQVSVVIIALFENICDREPILTVISNIAEDVRYCCFSEVHVKTMTETEFAELFYTSHRMGSAQILSMKSLNRDQDPMIPSSTHLFSH
jgi:hypothetical protein